VASHGSTGGAGLGTGGGGAGPAADLVATILARIEQHKRYPWLARRRGLEGEVELGFRVMPDGSVADLRVERSGGALFDEAAMAAVREAAPLPACAAPLRLPIRFRLTDQRAIR
jgi:protein TonB